MTDSTKQSLYTYIFIAFPLPIAFLLLGSLT